jgi:hypothetical protein
MGGRGASSSNTSKLPALEGSEKQIKWAEEIRKNALEAMQEEIKLFSTKEFKEILEKWENGNETEKKDAEIYRKFEKKINSNKAEVWIDNREIYENRQKANKYNDPSSLSELKTVKEMLQDKDVTKNRAYRRAIKYLKFRYL